MCASKVLTDKQNVGTVHRMEHHSTIKKRSSDTCYSMDEPWKHYAEWNKLDTKDKYNSTTKYWE